MKTVGKKKVVLLQGGLGAEREVSLSTGKGFAQALTELGYPFTTVDCKEDFLEQITKAKKDGAQVALIALHGKFAEDGIVQAICEYIKLPYSGSGVYASALCMDKVASKEVFINHNIPTPKYEIINNAAQNLKSYKPRISIPLVVKPAREGSSVGVTIVHEEKALKPALELAAQYDNTLIIEEFIDGMELTIPFLDERMLTPIEIVPKQDFYDYKNKYTAGRTDYIMPARLEPKTLQLAQEYANKAFKVCRLRNYGRLDLRVDKKGNPLVLEWNTLPGCTPTSLLPKSAKQDGISFNQLVEILVERAALDYEGVK